GRVEQVDALIRQRRFDRILDAVAVQVVEDGSRDGAGPGGSGAGAHGQHCRRQKDDGNTDPSNRCKPRLPADPPWSALATVHRDSPAGAVSFNGSPAHFSTGSRSKLEPGPLIGALLYL